MTPARRSDHPAGLQPAAIVRVVRRALRRRGVWRVLIGLGWTDDDLEGEVLLAVWAAHRRPGSTYRPDGGSSPEGWVVAVGRCALGMLLRRRAADDVLDGDADTLDARTAWSSGDVRWRRQGDADDVVDPAAVAELRRILGLRDR